MASPNASSTDAPPRPLAWITGADGLIGNYLAQTSPALWQARPLGRADLDLLDFAAVEALFRAERPGLVIHCAAMSKNPACDAQPALARRINTDATLHLAALAEEIPFVFFSTDLVFDGASGQYTEEAPVNPLSIYAETKVRAEEAVRNNPRHTILRTSLNAGFSKSGRRAFNEEMRLAWAAGKTTNLFRDEFRCPIGAEVTARAVWQIAGQGGLFHLCGAERLSRWEIGRLLAALHPDLNPKLEAGSLRDYQGPPRSPDTSMVCAKIQQRLDFALPRFSEWLGQCQPGPGAA